MELNFTQYVNLQRQYEYKIKDVLYQSSGNEGEWSEVIAYSNALLECFYEISKVIHDQLDSEGKKAFILETIDLMYKISEYIKDL